MARILVVDDDQMDRMILDSLLTEAGHELVLAEEGLSALDLYREQKFDLVVTDLVMPKLSGLRLIREILVQHSEAVIIAISGMSPEHLPLAEDFGAVETLTKPLDRDVLLRTVERALERRGSDG